MFGLYSDFTPKFAKQFANIGKFMQQGINEYIKEVADGTFPAKEHCYSTDQEIIEETKSRKKSTYLKGELKMIILKYIMEIKEQIKLWKKQGFSIGLVPTMGYLHEGHKSLIDKAVKENDKVIVSIFINPSQFGPNEDFNKYPKNLQNDSELCKNSCVDIVFIPEIQEMYPSESFTYVNVGKLNKGLCGATRPVHFKGVCTIVAKLFILLPQLEHILEKKTLNS